MTLALIHGLRIRQGHVLQFGCSLHPKLEPYETCPHVRYISTTVIFPSQNLLRLNQLFHLSRQNFEHRRRDYKVLYCSICQGGPARVDSSS
jgi:hypothetical protein